MNVRANILEAIGHTPLVKLNKLVGPDDATVFVKPEFMNPGGSIKDRMALYIIEKAERRRAAQARRHHRREHQRQHRHGRGALRGGEGLPLHLHDAGQDVEGEDRHACKAFGAEVVVTPDQRRRPTRPQSYYETAKRIARETPNCFYPEPVPQPRQHRGPLPAPPARRSGSRRAARSTSSSPAWAPAAP